MPVIILSLFRFVRLLGSGHQGSSDAFLGNALVGRTGAAG